MSENMITTCETFPLIGDPAPKFRATTTNGKINFPDDYAGHWIVFFSHPMDFTPVCTTEFLAFQSAVSDFKKLNTEIIGLSVGSVPSHLAWFRSIHDDIKFRDYKNVKIKFPVIEDIDLSIAKLYGMIHQNISDTKTVRAVFIIDPKGIVRTILYYPQTTGRNIAEILRVLTALQTTDAFGVSTPADWEPGLPVIKPSPKTISEMQKCIDAADKNTQSWYLTFRELPKSKIYEKLHKHKK